MRAALVVVFLLLALGVHGVLRASLGDLYRRWMRLALLAAALHGAATLGLLALLPRAMRMALPEWFKATFSLPAAGVLVSAFALVVLAPLWGPLSAALRRRARGGTAVAPVPRPAADGPAVTLLTRRRFLEVAAVAPPAALAATGPLGAMSAAGDPFVRRVELRFAGLPAGLDGLRLVQVSDVHVGHFVDAADLARAMEKVQAEGPDLFLVTGDLIDDLRQLAPTMEALASVRATHGSFACLGNHEHYAGLAAIRAAFDRSPLRLLVDEAEALRLPGATVELSGVDYPLGERGRRMTDPAGFAQHAERALVQGGRGGDFRLHLAHHPHAWDAAALRGADLTLSGHTHGGQFGLGSRSPFDPLYRYVRGVYEREGRKLFVHSGLGHWLPVRINCPPEIAVITLRRG